MHNLMAAASKRPDLGTASLGILNQIKLGQFNKTAKARKDYLATVATLSLFFVLGDKRLPANAW